MTTDPTDFAATIERFSGFADLYDKYRPEPPTVIAPILTQLAQTAIPQLVVDLGCGTGLSTRYWTEKAQTIIGIEPSADMRREAEAKTTDPRISYREGISSQTGLPDQCADIVTCSQALHWMDPQPTFDEAKRILRPGGVFAAYDYDWPPTTTSWKADSAYVECMFGVKTCESGCKDSPTVRSWGKDQHLSRMQSSGCFRYTKEIVVHHEDRGNAERLVGLLLSQGGVMTLLKRGMTESDLGIARFRAIAEHELGPAEQRWYWSSRLRCGIV